MKIAYLNPWKQAAENQCFKSLEQAAQRIGCSLAHCCCSDELIEANPDFVIAVASTQPKLTSFPTYGAIHEPRDRYLTNRAYYTNLLTYDGHMALADRLQDFMRALLDGLRRHEPVGCFYPTCQTYDALNGQAAAAISNRKTKLTYFGTHWDKRRNSFFKELSKLPNVEIYGPTHAWKHIEGSPGCKGPLPFDGLGPQQKYAENGIGLVLMADKHLLDNIISNRIFEITSVGAVALCPRMPWIEQHYGDSVYYFNQLLPDEKLLREIKSLLSEIAANPDEAIQRAARAQQIFRENFSAERMLQNACDYHNLRVRLAGAASKQAPEITVIVRSNENLPGLQRTLQSIANQSDGTFNVLLMGSPQQSTTSTFQNAFASFTLLEADNRDRVQSLWFALTQVASDYFAILDAGDEWMPNHVKCLLPDTHAPKAHFAYTGSICVRDEPILTGEKILERRFVSAFGDCRTVSFFEAPEFISTNSFLASTDLLDQFILQPPPISAGEDTLLILELLCNAEPKFNHRATAIHQERELPPPSGLDRTEIMRRVAGKAPRWPIVPDTYPALSASIAAFFRGEAAKHNWTVHVASAPAPTAQLSPRATRGKESFSQWRNRTFGRWHRSLHKRFPQVFPATDDRPRRSENGLSLKSK